MLGREVELIQWNPCFPCCGPAQAFLRQSTWESAQEIFLEWKKPREPAKVRAKLKFQGYYLAVKSLNLPESLITIFSGT